MDAIRLDAELLLDSKRTNRHKQELATYDYHSHTFWDTIKEQFGF